ncbi:MAG TPA: hypothetical protein DCM28_06660 [Phycisphaerales bacterium]|mgnify:FL=1|nr:hypothetical protein [Phycisphaerales bacterium]HCD31017.1 hypothetical protein [Phycisphaerales bacterium]|tara:strand:+ start:62 stop:778 length:717 start_codon:yes stop_codon:yes gene_type:complete
MALIRCSECGNNISSKANECPQCGAPNKKLPKQYGCGTLIVIIFFILIISSLTDLKDLTFSTTDLKPQTITANKNILPDTQSSASDFSNTTSATPQQNNSDTPIQNSVNSLVLQEKDRINSQNISDNIAHSNQIEQHNNEALIDKSESMQIKRKEMIDQFIFNGIFSKVAMPGSLPRVWVTYKFHGLTFEEKKTAIGVVYAYYFDGTDKVNGVRIFDSATNNEIGNYSITYPYLRLYK